MLNKSHMSALTTIMLFISSVAMAHDNRDRHQHNGYLGHPHRDVRFLPIYSGPAFYGHRSAAVTRGSRCAPAAYYSPRHHHYQSYRNGFAVVPNLYRKQRFTRDGFSGGTRIFLRFDD